MKNLNNFFKIFFKEFFIVSNREIFKDLFGPFCSSKCGILKDFKASLTPQNTDFLELTQGLET